ncbi:hypothetical protein AB0L59_41150 [Streptomyces sp. NPDC052109]|uniref:hypothetical protein n=1 Tax=Streptomyces sp. NPDC052109 TaxID=3155527 RepID=UPI0034465AA4
MRRIVLLVPVILLAAACSSGKPVPTVDGSVPHWKPTASPPASPSADAPKTADDPMVTWCHEHPLWTLCTSAGSPKPVFSMPPSAAFSSAASYLAEECSKHPESCFPSTTR